MNKSKIKIMKNGPYLVTGNVPLSEKIIDKNEKRIAVAVRFFCGFNSV